MTQFTKGTLPRIGGMDVYSSKAGISACNALKQLDPPPPHAVLGGKDAPWLRLTDWELMEFRKRMKKSAKW